MHRHNPSSEIAHLLAEVRQLTPQELLDTHGVEVDFIDKTTVFDSTYDRKFKNLQEWAKFVIAQENDEFEDEDEFDGGWGDDE